MGVIGITLIVASLAFFVMYPSTWRALAQPLMQWLQSDAADEAPASVSSFATDMANQEKAVTQDGRETTVSSVASSKTQKDHDSVSMPPPPPPPPTIRTPGKQDEEDEEEEATTPKAVPAIVQNGSAIPTFSLSGDDDDEEEDDNDDSDNMPPPMFPSPYSAQRAGASADPSRLAKATAAPPASTASTPSSLGLMAPPPRPAVSRGAAALAPVNVVRRPANLPIPNRGPPASSLRAPATASSSFSSTSSLAPPPSSTTKPKKPSRKVVLAPGHSPLDWARVAADPVGNRLRGSLPADAPYLLRVTPSQLKQMNGRKGRDAWTALGGMVYNISPYLPFHPGGAGELLRCAGKDGNQLFNDIHSWVNYDNMLSACRIGVMVEEHAATTSPMEEMD
ncbi:heme steroid-binding protein domain protein [Sporothrix brasiliensis 5110]|uniref:Heme steroid-binding protein domain protein n=1 Tax=Sporothrix brasiliensis 5110 TaxID=1398154 RepID=A0A0C2IW81_9PEZI|nr:heme steroid-binding protein domain protein [Sporothrix brasiliensis 5110]KIH91055.1 heme steroid-binding protein domain protein [Sporothrix brasiliensis 5110]